MNISKLVENCQNCPYKSHCENKLMEALAYLPEPYAEKSDCGGSLDAAAPILRETVTIRVDGKTVTVYKDELERQLYDHLYSGLGLSFGA